MIECVVRADRRDRILRNRAHGSGRVELYVFRSARPARLPLGPRATSSWGAENEFASGIILHGNWPYSAGSLFARADAFPQIRVPPAFTPWNAIAYGYRMAKKTTVILVDDIDGAEIEDGKGETVYFALDGVSYEIDLNDSNAQKLRDALQTYVDAGRRSVRSTRSAALPSRASRGGAKQDLGAVRDWLRAHGHTVSDRGRIPASLMDEYRANS
jgi:hypothetical protein